MSITGHHSLRLQILGPLRLWRGGSEVDTGPRQQAYLLALLLARVGQPTSTTELIDLIWGDDVPASALNIIQKYVGSLRRLLQPELPARANGSFVNRRANAYLFTAGPGTLDLVTFRDLVARAKAAAGPAAVDLYAEALAFWRGPAGGGVATATAAAPVFAALDDEFYEACAAASGVAASQGQPERVLPAVQLAASMAPFHEPVQGALIRVLGAAGRQAEALAVFRTVRDRLADELGVDPGPALVEAHQHVLTSAPSPSAGPATIPVTAPPPTATTAGLVGRTAELAILRGTVERALAGHTAIGFIEGEPGAGKTRLLTETAAIADRYGTLVVWGACLQGDGVPAMWPWEQALRPVVDSLPAPSREKWLAAELGILLEQRDDTAGIRSLPDGNAQFRLFEQVVAVIDQASAQRPTLLILDDLHWADTASLQLLGHLAARLPDRTAIVGALRDRAPLPGSDLSRVLAAASRLPDHRRFRLGPLGLTEVAALIRNETGADPEDAVAHSIHTRTSGNPFFVRELSRLLAGDPTPGTGVPSTVRDVVRDRMAGVEDGTSELLDVAALIGRDVDLRLLSRATAVDAADCLERLEPLHALGLLEINPDDPSTVRFAHDLVRESITETTTRQRSVRLHLRVADALDHIYAGDEAAAERLAYHLWAAGPLAEPARTAEALMRAGRRAASKLAYQAADRQLRLAAQLARTAGLMDQELSALTLLTIVVRRHSGYDSSTFDLLDRAEYLARSLGRDAEAADFLFIRTMGAYTSMEQERATLARRMHQHGQASSDPAVRSYGHSAWGLHQWDIGNIGSAYRSFTAPDSARPATAATPEHDTPLRRDGSIPGEGPGWRAVITALHGDVATALAFVDTWDRPGDPYALTVWVYYTTMIASMAGDPAVAKQACDRWADAGLDRLRTLTDEYIRQYQCWARALTGDDPAAAAAEAERLLAAGLLNSPQWGIAYHHALIAEMWLAAGRPDEAAAALERADRAVWDHGQRYAEGLILLMRARLLQANGEPATTVRAAAEKARTRSAQREDHLFAERATRLLATLDETSPVDSPHTGART
ncbi:hypothetical protein GCM10010112_66300 [Actinoplanes lobatus]|uniref:DNA-binding SARP family transcriptional activator n=1 Tax=Actinoplanes lobatus TaxID=113568 RepID=A0A7W7HJW4_9ACTN|nr:BTAD domain-containing putative transcriptional regulator [Actinoplanes lobatus]MBB4751895.1 DNA-binding SARP family transcriptional activator [Actinoplanes lobatus]GGN85648.1 hypothetical protein GCM10010112_66300 [Actinoplanes lobatus]GIE44379.1 hypothetical protein Alo02nite_72770 [Actinoplanes lobatus]